MNLHDFLAYWQNAYLKIGLRYFLLAGTMFLLFYIVLKKLLLHRKVQPKFPKISDYGRDIFFSGISIGIFAFISVFTFTILKPYTNMYDQIDEYGMLYYIFTFIWMYFLHDAYFYWSHRLMHHPKIFKHVHLIHHKSTNPSPWTAYAFHPFEGLIEALIVTIIAFSIPTHRSAIIIYTLFQITYNVYGHLGFEILPKKIVFKKYVDSHDKTRTHRTLQSARTPGNRHRKGDDCTHQSTPRREPAAAQHLRHLRFAREASTATRTEERRHHHGATVHSGCQRSAGYRWSQRAAGGHD